MVEGSAAPTRQNRQRYGTATRSVGLAQMHEQSPIYVAIRGQHVPTLHYHRPTRALRLVLSVRFCHSLRWLFV